MGNSIQSESNEVDNYDAVVVDEKTGPDLRAQVHEQHQAKTKRVL